MMYPEFESVRQALRRKKWNDGEYNEEKVRNYTRDMVRFASEQKEKAIAYWREKEEQATEQSQFWEADKAAVERSSFQRSSIFALLTEPYGLERLHPDGTVSEFKQLLLSVCSEMSISDRECVGGWADLAFAKPKKRKKAVTE
jgi:hypothetical protein